MAKSPKKKSTTRKARTTPKQMPKKKLAPKKTTKKQTSKKAMSKKATVTSGGIKKEYVKSRNACRVTFRLPRIAAPDAKSVCILGDFNNWNVYANPMKRLKNGDYTIALELEPGSEYQFRYLIDESKWENDWNADNYIKSPYGDSNNSVIIV